MNVEDRIKSHIQQWDQMPRQDALIQCWSEVMKLSHHVRTIVPELKDIPSYWTDAEKNEMRESIFASLSAPRSTKVEPYRRAARRLLHWANQDELRAVLPLAIHKP